MSKYLTFLSLAKRLPPGGFLLIWTLLNLAQAFFTEVHNDESYYWLYTQRLQWGYYDHPPMVALFASLGQLLFEKEIGLRLGNVLLYSAAVGMLLKMTPRSRLSLTYVLLLSVPFLHYLSFMVFPDGPLLFFLVAFLYAYRRFLETNDLKLVLLMSCMMAGMLYSKYYAVLVLPLVVLRRPSNLLKTWPYLVFLIASILFIPHLYWQYIHDFPSFRFHLAGRTQSFAVSDVLEFLGQQLGAVGLVIPFAILYKPKAIFEKDLKFLVLGVYLFFLLASFRGFVHIQWTSLAYFPAIFLAAAYLRTQTRLVVWALTPWILLTFFLRLQLIWPLVPSEKIGPNYVRGQESWAQELSTIAPKDGFLVYENDLKEPSMYAFYTGRRSVAFYPGFRKKSQYWMWHVEDSAQGMPATIVKKDSFPGSDALQSGKRKVYYEQVKSFASFQNIICEVVDRQYSNGELNLQVKVLNHRSTPIGLGEAGGKLYLHDLERHQYLPMYMSEQVVVVPPKGQLVLSLSSLENVAPGTYTLAIDDGILAPSNNSGVFTVN